MKIEEEDDEIALLLVGFDVNNNTNSNEMIIQTGNLNFRLYFLTR